MTRSRAEDRYRSRPRAPERRIVIVSGDRSRVISVRPWVVAVGATVGAALAASFLGATAYLVFRDDLINTAFSRNAGLQQAYEDRIAALRSEIDKIASRQILDQVAYDEKVDRLLAAQRGLDRRQQMVDELIDQARATGLIGADHRDDRAAAEVPARSDAAAAYAADTAAAIDARFAGLEASPAASATFTPASGPTEDALMLGPDGKPDLKAMTADLSRLDAEQTEAVRAISAAAEARAEKAVGIVDRLGVKLKLAAADPVPADSGADAMGGPFIPLGDASSLGAALDQAEAAFDKLGRVKRAVAQLPVAAPLEGAAMTSNFGSRSDPFLGSAAFHAGIDFRSPSGRPVEATAPGRVVAAGRNGGYGNMVEIDHGKGLTTRYAHLSRIDVEVGERVERGTVVGRVGSTGRSTGPHLHYETRIAGEPVNPATYLRAGRELDTILR